jgi:hypothetical protein
MANLIQVSVLKYGHEEFGTTLADAKTMVLSTEHIIYGTNVETDTGIDVTTATAATDAVTTGSAHGITTGEYVRIGNIGDSVGTFDIDSSDYVPGNTYKVKATGATGLFLHLTEAHYDANTKQDITTNGSSLTLDLIRVQGELIYADTQNGGRPIKIRTVEPCVNMATTDNLGMASKSGQLMLLDCEKKNGVKFDKPSDILYSKDILLNLDRFILAYEDANASGDFIVWYDCSNTNKAGMDSSHVDILQIDNDFDTMNERFVNHLGGKTALSSFKSLTVNGNTVAFPDVSASGLVRLSNIASAHENAAGNDLHIKLRGANKPGWDTLIVDEKADASVALTEVALTT